MLPLPLRSVLSNQSIFGTHSSPGFSGVSSTFGRGGSSGTRAALYPLPGAQETSRDNCGERPRWVEWGSGAAAVGRACLLPPLSSGGALVARPWLRFHFPLIEPDMRISLHPALGQDLTPSPTARRAQAGSDARARRSRRGAGVDTIGVDGRLAWLRRYRRSESAGSSRSPATISRTSP